VVVFLTDVGVLSPDVCVRPDRDTIVHIRRTSFWTPSLPVANRRLEWISSGSSELSVILILSDSVGVTVVQPVILVIKRYLGFFRWFLSYRRATGLAARCLAIVLSASARMSGPKRQSAPLRFPVDR
jgi:hypothetical protein